jgi:hypothetical protein
MGTGVGVDTGVGVGVGTGVGVGVGTGVGVGVGTGVGVGSGIGAGGGVFWSMVDQFVQIITAKIKITKAMMAEIIVQIP